MNYKREQLPTVSLVDDLWWMVLTAFDPLSLLFCFSFFVPFPLLFDVTSTNLKAEADHHAIA